MATYVAQVAPIVDTAAHYAAYGQSFGGAFTTFGWVAQTGHGEVVASGTGASYAWTTVVAPTTTLTAQTGYNFRGAFVPSTTYTGTNSAGSSNVDVVTSAGVTYAHITATSSSATAPGSDTTNWQPLIFEIWKTNGSNTTGSNPIAIFIKIVYTVSQTAGTAPRLSISIGTGVDAGGNITGAMTLTGVTPTTVVNVDNSTTSSSTVLPNIFSGDADNFRCIIQSGAASVGLSSWLVIARAQTTAGVDTNDYVFVGTGFSIATVRVVRSAVFPNSQFSSGAAISQSATQFCGITTSAGCGVNTTGLSNVTQPFPIFPLVGQVTNPLIGVMGFHFADVIDGEIVPVWIYGASHNYMTYAKDGASAASLDGGLVNGGVIPGILFE